MPTPPSSPKDLSNLLARSRLVSADDLKNALQSVPLTGRDADDLESFRKLLVANKLLTEYQSALVMRGHSEGFFLNDYKVMELISKGRMSGVYKGMHSSGQIVAIKVLPASKARDAEVLARFRREAKLLARLDHPNVVRSFHAGESEGRHYFVLEYLDGDTLEEILESRQRLTPVEAVRVVYQALLGLQHIHERGMIHRDLSPANLMLLETGSKSADSTLDRPVKILDIGLGKAVFDDNAKSHVDDPSTLTGEGILLGTPDYLAPEQAKNASQADIRSDIYSLGCVLYHALTGQPPFQDKSVVNSVLRHATEQPRPLSESMAQVPDGLQSVLNWMLAKNPAQRYPTPDRAAQALQLFLNNTPQLRPAPAPLAAYVKFLESSDDVDIPKQPSAPPTGIPVGKLEGTKKPAPARAASPVPDWATDSVPTAAAPAVTVTPVARPAAQPAFVEASFDVELVPVDDLAAGSPRYRPTQRSLADLDRRDAMLACIGGGIVLAAGLMGYGLAKLLRKEVLEDPE